MFEDIASGQPYARNGIPSSTVCTQNIPWYPITATFPFETGPLSQSLSQQRDVGCTGHQSELHFKLKSFCDSYYRHKFLQDSYRFSGHRKAFRTQAWAMKDKGMGMKMGTLRYPWKMVWRKASLNTSGSVVWEATVGGNQIKGNLTGRKNGWDPRMEKQFQRQLWNTIVLVHIHNTEPCNWGLSA